ncbi:predicted protein [Aspergillus nidulans FGSC A4]|uniref:Protein kinase domain-containing protein n=1 Tax=Emericella nidulans (strain FGSC A4 / ATCC 38163 / CBS 112.46 / NRRL 194 / M139) TaxID=227321 RepID=Q5BDR5_EMENI|nr:protein srpkC [Aspergillus nidulans FGSC A4]EAA65498.1 predicted protein [Aspergillus nidulans FGSC A4]CBF87732.1 TPA: conserved hypothetical protein [Aspergillus nidulans FGSC A4]|eukprot:XP_658919.1 predicted protein [Aspergillus nidulans FGSC A4]
MSSIRVPPTLPNWPRIDVPQQNRSEERYTVIPSTPLRRYYFNEDDKARVSEIDIALGDWGVSSWTDPHLSENIQPVALRAPEVLIHAPGTQAPTFGTSTPSCLNWGPGTGEGDLDDEGRVKGGLATQRPQLSSDSFMPGLDKEVRDEFASWLRAAMRINPTERASAEDLLRHPWLGAL